MKRLRAQIDLVYGKVLAKRDLLLEYEKQTQCILVCDVDDIETHVSRRQALIEKIDGIDACVEETCCKNEPDLALLYRAVQNKCAMEELPQNMVCVFRAGQEVFAVANRIRETEIQAMQRLELEKERLLERIKEVNRSTTAKAAKYFSPPIPQERVLLNTKYAKV